MARIEDILTTALKDGASDVHLVCGLRPMFRINTMLSPAQAFTPVSAGELEDFVRSAIGDDRFTKFHRMRDIDFSTTLRDLGRFRVNAHYQQNTIAISLRAVSPTVKTIEQLHLPNIIESFIDLKAGLVLVTGATGSGKSTTLAAMIQSMNQRHKYHIITMEDPIEYEISSNLCVIEQRELGRDVGSFAAGLRYALRQDPDVILVGEMRDLETTSAAITAAETGHLVLSTLHTSSAAMTIERIVDIYPAAQQNQIRTMLANSLQAVVSMRLLKRADSKGMIPACEIMVCTSAIRNCIREARIHEIPNIIMTAKRDGMCMMEDSIKELYNNGLIGHEEGMQKSDFAMAGASAGS
ncbi:MAG: PilT/PilU family type 4a pilus ATPase [Planctomycetes bacterium]|nr:PilT/PilU family type 4a pilus ATPase [Planctomycetota bacterium]